MRKPYTNDYIRGTAEMRRYNPEQERAALRARIPEQLPETYVIIRTDTTGRETNRYSSDSLSQLHANAGVGLDAVRRMIDTGESCKIWGGRMKIVPASAAGAPRRAVGSG